MIDEGPLTEEAKRRRADLLERLREFQAAGGRTVRMSVTAAIALCSWAAENRDKEEQELERMLTK